MTIDMASRIGNCTSTTIRKLIAENKIKYRKLANTGVSSKYDILNTEEEIKDIIKTNAPRSGFKFSKKKKNTPKFKVVSNTRIKFNRLHDALKFIELPDEKRALILKMSSINIEDLKLLLSLVK